MKINLKGIVLSKIKLNKQVDSKSTFKVAPFCLIALKQKLSSFMINLLESNQISLLNAIKLKNLNQPMLILVTKDTKFVLPFLLSRIVYSTLNAIDILVLYRHIKVHFIAFHKHLVS